MKKPLKLQPSYWILVDDVGNVYGRLFTSRDAALFYRDSCMCSSATWRARKIVISEVTR